jgi:hypothetical protein
MKSILLSAALLALLGAPAAARTASPAPAPAACTDPDHRAFDFWVGAWDVYPVGTDKLVAHSLIERLYGGCAIRENWMPLRGPGGGSLSSWVPEEKAWRQTWVDSSGARVDFTGAAPAPGRMVLTGPWKDVLGPGKSALVGRRRQELAALVRLPVPPRRRDDALRLRRRRIGVENRAGEAFLRRSGAP